MRGIVGNVAVVGCGRGRLSKRVRFATRILKLSALMRGFAPLDVKRGHTVRVILAQFWSVIVIGAVQASRVADMMPSSARPSAVCPRGGRDGLRAYIGLNVLRISVDLELI